MLGVGNRKTRKATISVTIPPLRFSANFIANLDGAQNRTLRLALLGLSVMVVHIWFKRLLIQARNIA